MRVLLKKKFNSQLAEQKTKQKTQKYTDSDADLYKKTQPNAIVSVLLLLLLLTVSRSDFSFYLEEEPNLVINTKRTVACRNACDDFTDALSLAKTATDPKEKKKSNNIQSFNEGVQEKKKKR